MSISLMRPVVHLVFKLRCLTTDHVARMGRNVLLFSILFPSPWCCIQALLSSNLTLSPICSHSIPNPLRQPEEILPIERTIHAGHNSRGGPLCARIYSQGGRLDRISRGGGDNSWAWRAGGRYWINQDQGFHSTLSHKYY